MLEPVFVKGDVEFELPQHPDILSFQRKNISLFGVTSLDWGDLDPQTFFGLDCVARVKTVSPTSIQFETRARIIREFAIGSAQMGLRFILGAENREALSHQIRVHGFHPTDHVRKYPRIPSMSSIRTFPLRALVRLDEKISDGSEMIFEVGNLSPNGMLLSSENSLSLALEPGSRIHIQLEPRGPFPAQILVHGLVCRITDSIVPDTGNMIRYFGIKFTKVDDLNRAAFLDLLKDILERLRS